MRGIESISRSIKTEDGEIRVVTETKPGDFVVCNLASLSLGRIPVQDGEYLDSLVATAVRALDNVIDLNFYPTPYAEITNRQYRSIGLGMSGYHHMLAKHGIKWESEEHLNFADKVFERINMAAIRASSDIAAEKGLISTLRVLIGKTASTSSSVSTTAHSGKNYVVQYSIRACVTPTYWLSLLPPLPPSSQVLPQVSIQ